jgi:hypothetical protein
VRTKKTRRELAAVRARALAPLEWVAQPEWALGGVAIVTPVGDGPRGDDIAAMAAVTEEVYVEALEAAVEAGELNRDYLEAEQQARSWARFLPYCEGDHGPHACHCSAACLAKHPAPPSPRPPAVPAVEAWPNEAGPRQRRDLETERTHDDERELEQQRLLRIANEAGPRWFTT